MIMYESVPLGSSTVDADGKGTVTVKGIVCDLTSGVSDGKKLFKADCQPPRLVCIYRGNERVGLVCHATVALQTMQAVLLCRWRGSIRLLDRSRLRSRQNPIVGIRFHLYLRWTHFAPVNARLWRIALGQSILALSSFPRLFIIIP